MAGIHHLEEIQLTSWPVPHRQKRSRNKEFLRFHLGEYVIMYRSGIDQYRKHQKSGRYSQERYLVHFWDMNSQGWGVVTCGFSGMWAVGQIPCTTGEHPVHKRVELLRCSPTIGWSILTHSPVTQLQNAQRERVRWYKSIGSPKQWMCQACGCLRDRSSESLHGGMLLGMNQWLGWNM